VARRAEERFEDAALQPAVHAHHHVLERGHLVEEPDVLERARHAQRRDLVRRLTGDARSVEDDLAAGGLVDARQHVEERRLAGPVRPDEAHDRAARDEEVHVLDGDQAAELLPDPVGLEDVAVGAHLAVS
jgi:hypothetical protein